MDFPTPISQVRKSIFFFSTVLYNNNVFLSLNRDMLSSNRSRYLYLLIIYNFISFVDVFSLKYILRVLRLSMCSPKSGSVEED